LGIKKEGEEGRRIYVPAQLWIPKGEIFVGVDESNHGQEEEIYSGVLSTNPDDSIKRKYPKTKNSRARFTFSNSLISRPYSFAQISIGEYKRLGDECIAVFVASLLNGYNFSNLNWLHLLLDGEHRDERKKPIKGLVSKITEISTKKINFSCGKDFDRFYKIVNLADHLARYLYEHRDESKIKGSPYRRRLIQ